MTDGYDLERIEALREIALQAGPCDSVLDVVTPMGGKVLVDREAHDYANAILAAVPSMLSDLRLLREARESGALERAAHPAHWHPQIRTDAATLRRLASGEPCPICRDEGWVCEDHPDRAWGGGEGCCGGAGMLCACRAAVDTRLASGEP